MFTQKYHLSAKKKSTPTQYVTSINQCFIHATKHKIIYKCIICCNSFLNAIMYAI